MKNKLLVLFFIIFSNASYSQDVTNYYPLKIENKWVLKWSFLSDPSNSWMNSKTIEGTDIINQISYYRQKQRITSADSSIDIIFYEWLCYQDSGIVIGASGPNSNIESADIYNPQRLLLPNNIAELGLEWDYEDLFRKYRSTITNIDTIITVSSGQFLNCIKIYREDIEKSTGNIDRKLNIFYAKDIGEVLQSGWSKWEQDYTVELIDFFSPPTSINGNKFAFHPQNFSLHQNFPNPFNLSTTIRYAIGITSNIQITIYDEIGRNIRTLINTTQNSGLCTIVWDGRNKIGKTVPSGIYFYSLKVDNQIVSTKQMVVIK